jgi:hypothetical protein
MPKNHADNKPMAGSGKKMRRGDGFRFGIARQV